MVVRLVRWTCFFLVEERARLALPLEPLLLPLDLRRANLLTSIYTYPPGGALNTPSERLRGLSGRVRTKAERGLCQLPRTSSTGSPSYRERTFHVLG